MQSFAIAGREIGPQAPPFIIAELSANHGGDLGRAKRIIDAAADAGADAIKLQLYSADSLTLDVDRPEFRISGKSLWQGERLWDLYARAATPTAWFPELFAYARARDLVPFASVFDERGIAALEALAAPAFKIASFEAVDLELIAACARTGKPLIVSTGLCTADEIGEAVAAFRDAGGRDLCLLRCNSAYPADPAEADLATIPDMMARFDVPVGYSDHTLDQVQAMAAVALGACAIEKHLIDARTPPTADSAFSSEPQQFRQLVDGCRAAFTARGAVRYGPSRQERGSLMFRRSLFASRAIARGEAFSRDNVRAVRPGAGVAPKHLPDVLGRKAARAIAAGEPLSWDMIASPPTPLPQGEGRR